MGVRHLAHINIKLVLLILSICLERSSAIASFDISSESVADDQLKFLKSFSNCITHIINFQEYNINLSILIQPVVLLNYDSPQHFKDLFPTKLLKQELELTDALHFDRITTLPQTFIDKVHRSSEFHDQLFQDNFRISSKRTNCDFHLYLHPPIQQVSPHMYHEVYWSKSHVLKHPFWISKLNTRLFRTESLYARPKTSLLICKKVDGSTCENEDFKQNWISSVLQNGYKIEISEIILIFETKSHKIRLSILCPYCNPCNSLQMVDISHNTMHFNTLLKTFKMLTQKTYPQIITVVLLVENNEMYGNMLIENGAKSRKTLLNNIAKFDGKDNADFLPFLFDAHIIQILCSENITFKYTSTFDELAWTDIQVQSCNKPIHYSLKFRPAIQRKTNGNLGYFREIGLAFHKEQLRFVSCHKEITHWIHRLIELVFAFDAPTWFLVFWSLTAIAIISNLAHKPGKLAAFWNAYFALISTMVEQSSNLRRYISEKY